jgi:hypothetical protein
MGDWGRESDVWPSAVSSLYLLLPPAVRPTVRVSTQAPNQPSGQVLCLIPSGRSVRILVAVCSQSESIRDMPDMIMSTMNFSFVQCATSRAKLKFIVDIITFGMALIGYTQL